jgi:hypothetical protein
MDYEEHCYTGMDGHPLRRVSEADFIRAERGAGFHPKFGSGKATGGFSGGGVHGSVRTVANYDCAEGCQVRAEHTHPVATCPVHGSELTLVDFKSERPGSVRVVWAEIGEEDRAPARV